MIRRIRPELKAGADPTPKPKDARLAAVALLARRDFAAGELTARLQQEGYPPDSVAAVIADLTAGHILDDSRFATQYVAYHADRGQGPRRIALELAKRGVPPADIEAALAAGPDWSARAREVRIRRFGLSLPQSWAEKAKQGRFLQYRGFSSDHVRSALGPDFESDEAP
ncbi:MAG TPA: regulatory protein RecX [Steroidobacteraceae bacterium]|nr:regulatory protein RecX [Steroidobacteraceae bacterium]